MVNLTGSLASTTISVCHLYGRSEVKSLSPVFATPGTVAYQAPLSIGFSRQEYWTGLSLPPSGDLPDPGIEPSSPVSPVFAGRFFTTAPPGKPKKVEASA